MLLRHEYRGITWIDLESPTPGDVRSVMDEFSIHPAVGEELLVSSYRSRVDRHDGYMYLILHFPTFGKKLDGGIQEVDFLIGKNFIITTRYNAMDPFLRFARIFEANSILESNGGHVTTGGIFIYMIRTLYQTLDGELEYLMISLDRIEDNIFNGQEREMVFELSKISRALLSFKQALTPHKGTLESLEAIGSRFFGTDFMYQLKAASADYHRVADGIISERDVLLELRETNNSLLSTKQNETTQHLTMMAFVTFPLTLVATIFGMNTIHNPIVGLPNDFWIIIGIMIFITTSFFVYFKYRKWL